MENSLNNSMYQGKYEGIEVMRRLPEKEVMRKLPQVKQSYQTNSPQTNYNENLVAQPVAQLGYTPIDENPAYLAKCFLMRESIKIYKGKIYLFEEGAYFQVEEYELKQMLNSYFAIIAEKNRSTRIFDQIIDFLMVKRELAVQEKDLELLKDKIAFKNGYLDLNTGAFFKSTSLFFLNKLDVEYNIGYFNTKTEMFDKFLLDIADGDICLVGRIYEIIGYVISNDIAGKVIFLFQGVTNSGKSTLINFIRGLFAAFSTTSIKVNDLGGRFTLSEIQDKALCVDSEIPNAPIKAEAVASLKSLSSTDLIGTDVKYSNRKTFINRAKIILATNHNFKIATDDIAFLNRVIVVPFNKSIGKHLWDTNILARLEQEKLGVILKSLNFYLKLKNNKYRFSGAYELNANIAQNNCFTNREMKIKNIILTYCEFIENEFTFKEDLHRLVLEAGLNCTIQEFSQIMDKLFQGQLTSGRKRRSKDKNPQNYYCGIKIINSEAGNYC